LIIVVAGFIPASYGRSFAWLRMKEGILSRLEGNVMTKADLFLARLPESYGEQARGERTAVVVPAFGVARCGIPP